MLSWATVFAGGGGRVNDDDGWWRVLMVVLIGGRWWCGDVRWWVIKRLIKFRLRYKGRIQGKNIFFQRGY